MTQFTSEHRDHAQTLQSELSMFETDLQVALDEVWKKPLETSGETGEDTWAARMEELEKKRIDPTEKITKPLIPTQDWRSKLFELGL
jgi:elongator complex protein 1